jgi:hypothetical protein
MPYRTDPRVDAYIAALPDWRAGGWRKLKQQAGP